GREGEKSNQHLGGAGWLGFGDQARRCGLDGRLGLRLDALAQLESAAAYFRVLAFFRVLDAGQGASAHDLETLVRLLTDDEFIRAKLSDEDCHLLGIGLGKGALAKIFEEGRSVRRQSGGLQNFLIFLARVSVRVRWVFLRIEPKRCGKKQRR